MTQRVALILLPVVLTVTAASTGAEPGSDSLAGAIDYLISYVKNSDCIFIRNGREHSGRDAVVHIQRKYAHFRDEIKTPEDFIRLTATKSLLTGKPYLVKTPEGVTLTSEDWLLEALQSYRARQGRQGPDQAVRKPPD